MYKAPQPAVRILGVAANVKKKLPEGKKLKQIYKEASLALWDSNRRFVLNLCLQEASLGGILLKILLFLSFFPNAPIYRQENFYE